MSTPDSATKLGQASNIDAQSPLSQSEANALVTSWISALKSPYSCDGLSTADRETLQEEFSVVGDNPRLVEIGAIPDQYPFALPALQELCKQSGSETNRDTGTTTESTPPGKVTEGRVERLQGMLRRLEARVTAINRLTSGKARVLDIEKDLVSSELAKLDPANTAKAVLRGIHAEQTTLFVNGEESGCLFTKEHAEFIDTLLTMVQNARADTLRYTTSDQSLETYDGKSLAEWQKDLYQLYERAKETLDDDFGE